MGCYDLFTNDKLAIGQDSITRRSPQLSSQQRVEELVVEMIDEAAHVGVEGQSNRSMTAVLQIQERVGEKLRRAEPVRLAFIVFQREALVVGVDEAVDINREQLIVEFGAVET